MVSIAPETVHRTVDGEAVLLDLKKGRYYGLNATGTTIWEILSDRAATFADLERAIVERFDVNAIAARSDLQRILVELEDAGLVKIQR